MFRRGLQCALMGFAFLLPAAGEAATFTLCLKWWVQTTDSGRTVTLPSGATITEDHWSTTDVPRPKAANGVLFAVSRPGFNQNSPRLVKADPVTGCGTFSDTRGTHVYLVRAYTISLDNNGNTIRVANGAGDPFFFDQLVQARNGTTYVPPFPAKDLLGNPPSKNAKARATMAAIAAFSAYRSTFGVSGKFLDIVEGAASSAHAGAGVDLSRLSQGYIRISMQAPSASDPSDARTLKFHVSHEMGHAWLLLNHGGGVEPEVKLDYDASADTSDDCHYFDDDALDKTYTIDSLEYNSVGFREGAAHFYAARVWNDAHPEGVFSWFGSSGKSLARYANPDAGGGKTFQKCVTPDRTKAILCADNVTTNQDWLRFWWAWHTKGVSPASTILIRNVYERTLDNGGLEKDNYLRKLGAAVQQVANANQKFAFSVLSDWHGVSSGDNSRCP